MRHQLNDNPSSDESSLPSLVNSQSAKLIALSTLTFGALSMPEARADWMNLTVPGLRELTTRKSQLDVVDQGVVFQLRNSITIVWDPNSENDLAGYRVYNTSSSNPNLTPVIEAGLNVRATIPNIEVNSISSHYVTAYNLLGLESAPSRDVHFWQGEVRNLTRGKQDGMTTVTFDFLKPSLTPYPATFFYRPANSDLRVSIGFPNVLNESSVGSGVVFQTLKMFLPHIPDEVDLIVGQEVHNDPPEQLKLPPPTFLRIIRSD